MYSFTYIQVLKLLTGSTVRDVSCRTYRRFHATLTASTGIQAVSSQSCCAAALENKCSRQLAPPTASSSVLLTTSQRQTMSTRSSSVKRCLPNASSKRGSRAKIYQALFSAGSKVIRGIIARRRESLGTRFRANVTWYARARI